MMLDYDFGLGDWIVRPQRCCVERGSEVVRLAPKAMAVLTRLAASPGEVVTRQELFDSVWPRVDVSDDALTQRVAELRRAFDDSPQDPSFIETIPKVGLRLVCPVTEIPAEPDAASEVVEQPAGAVPTLGPVSIHERPEPEDHAHESLYGTRPAHEVESPEADSTRGPLKKPWRVSLRSALGLALITAALATLVNVAVLNDRVDGVPLGPSTSDVMRFSIPLRDQNDLHYGDCYNMREPAPQGRYPTSALAFSSDGQMLLFAARDLETDTQQLYIRRLDSDEIRPVPGTEGGYGPSFTPDDRWIGFFDGRYLKRVPVEGGEAEIIFEARFNGCSLGTGITLAEFTWVDETTFFVPVGRSLVRIDAHGSVVGDLATTDEDDGYLGYHGLHPLPGGNTMLLHRYPLNLDPARAAVFALNVDSGESKLLVSDAMQPVYLGRTGHLLFMRRGTLMAAAFDLEAVELAGEPFVAQPDIMQAVFMHHIGAETGEGQLALSQAGHLAYVPGGIWSGVPRPLLRVRPDGSTEPFLSLGEKQWGQVRISPAGDRLLFGTVNGSSQATAHIYDLARNVTRRLETGGFKDHEYAWSPDGSAIAYGSNLQDGIQNVYVLRLDGEQAPERVAASTSAQWVTDWAVDGSIVYLQDWDIWRLPPDGEAYAMFQSDELEAYARVSPDGAWLAYTAFRREGGREAIDVYVRPFPGPGPATLIANEGMAPIWSRDGTQLFYLAGQPGSAEMMVVDMADGKPSPARWVMHWPHSVLMPITQFDVLADGSFIASPVRVADEPYLADHIEVVLNFATLLERRTGSAGPGD